jgi:hypothetical protein
MKRGLAAVLVLTACSSQLPQRASADPACPCGYVTTDDADAGHRTVCMRTVIVDGWPTTRCEPHPP